MFHIVVQVCNMNATKGRRLSCCPIARFLAMSVHQTPVVRYVSGRYDYCCFVHFQEHLLLHSVASLLFVVQVQLVVNQHCGARGVNHSNCSRRPLPRHTNQSSFCGTTLAPLFLHVRSKVLGFKVHTAVPRQHHHLQSRVS